MSWCVHCNKELPEGARYCVSCGKAVYEIQAPSPSWQLPVKAGGGFSHLRFMDLEPYREEQKAQEKEYLRNAASLVNVEPEAAALVVYGSEWMHGEKIELSVSIRASPQIDVKMSKFHALISPRHVNGRVFYVALFPRIYFFTYDGRKADITHATCELKGLFYKVRGISDYKTEEVTVYPGLITEVDWSRLERR